jgi:wyosine [tRNA(Phe)-imidazoG37] synthetase (radical SAM superfamily)
MPENIYLTPEDHNRNVADLTYVYPVVSRRAKGVSVGINLNVNNACNWRCIYCQVPGLSRGGPPPIDLKQLEQELNTMLSSILRGDFMQQHVDETHRQLKDIAFSGNGEPTSAKEFPEAIEIVAKVLRKFDPLGKIKVRLISNGSLIDKPKVIAGLKQLAIYNGEVWFKLDAGSREGIARINDVILAPKTHLARLKACAAACPTFVQTCMFALDGQPPSPADIDAYIDALREVSSVIKGVHLYGLARPSYQPEAARLSRLPEAWLEQVAVQIRTLGLEVFVSP